MKQKIVKLEILDSEVGDLLETYHLINPNIEKLLELKKKIEHRFDCQMDENLSEKEKEELEFFCDNIWDAVDMFIKANFKLLDVDSFAIHY